jgi:hypothetical protein
LALNNNVYVAVGTSFFVGLEAGSAFFAYEFLRSRSYETVSANPFTGGVANEFYVYVAVGTRHFVGLGAVGAGFAYADGRRIVLEANAAAAFRVVVAASKTDFASVVVERLNVGSNELLASTAERAASYETIVKSRVAGGENHGALFLNEASGVTAGKVGGIGAGESCRRAEGQREYDYGFHVETPKYIVVVVFVAPLRERVVSMRLVTQSQKYFFVLKYYL